MSPITSRHARLLSNGRYTVMLTAAGSGFSRWREDPTCDGRETRSPDFGLDSLIRPLTSIVLAVLFCVKPIDAARPFGVSP